ncbi:hypothetical protein FRC17_005793 [Serendipita sp. 399]|nr:hypothetical protein FRC17_005793 [Serendipita sp. 399]
MDPSHDQAFNQSPRVSTRTKRKRKRPTPTMPSPTKHLIDNLTRRLSNSSISDNQDDDAPKAKRVSRPKSPFVFRSTPSPKQSIKVYRDPNASMSIYAAELGFRPREPVSAPTTMRHVWPAGARRPLPKRESRSREFYQKQLAPWGVDLADHMFQEDSFQAARRALRRTKRASSVGILGQDIARFEGANAKREEKVKVPPLSVSPLPGRKPQPLLPAISLRSPSTEVPEDARERPPLSSPDQSSDEEQSPLLRSFYRPVYKEWVDFDNLPTKGDEITLPSIYSSLKTPENRHSRPFSGDRSRTSAVRRRVLTPRSNTPTLSLS